MSQAGSLESQVYQVNIMPSGREEGGERAVSSLESQNNSRMEEPLMPWEELYFQKVNQFYKEVDTIKEKSKHRRIRPEIPQLLFYVGSQLLSTILKYLILSHHNSRHINTYVEVFAIVSLASFLYFFSISTFQLGIREFLKFQLHQDEIQLGVVLSVLLSQYYIGAMDLSAQHSLALRIAYPAWLIYLSSTIRIQVLVYKYNRLETVLAKLMLLVEFTASLATLSSMLSGQGYSRLSWEPASGKYISYLYFVVHALTVASYYKLYSRFDGTHNLRYDFFFENSLEAKIRNQIKLLKSKIINIESKTEYEKKKLQL